jgi:hypothetical protein
VVERDLVLGIEAPLIDSLAVVGCQRHRPEGLTVCRVESIDRRYGRETAVERVINAVPVIDPGKECVLERPCDELRFGLVVNRERSIVSCVVNAPRARFVGFVWLPFGETTAKSVSRSVYRTFWRNVSPPLILRSSR